MIYDRKTEGQRQSRHSGWARTRSLLVAVDRPKKTFLIVERENRTAGSTVVISRRVSSARSCQSRQLPTGDGA